MSRSISGNKENWHKRDHDSIIREFGGVTGFVCPTDYVRMVECANRRINVIVDYMYDSYRPEPTWPVDVAVVWSQPNVCTTYVSGKAKYHGEQEYLAALYRKSGIKNGKVPLPVEQIGNTQMWLSDNHRRYDDWASCMDIDAWSVSPAGQRVVWDMKHANGKWSNVEDRCIMHLGMMGIPVVKVQYCIAAEQWIHKYNKDFVRIWPANTPAMDLFEEEYQPSDIDFPLAVATMNGVVSVLDACALM